MNYDKIPISLVKSNSCLYEKKNINYKNSTLKTLLWRRMSMDLEEIYKIKTSAEQVSKRWSSLRDRFVREHNNRQVIESASGSVNILKNESPFYKEMDFPTEHIKHRKTKGSLELEIQQNMKESMDDHKIIFKPFSDDANETELDIPHAKKVYSTSSSQSTHESSTLFKGSLLNHTADMNVPYENSNTTKGKDNSRHPFGELQTQFNHTLQLPVLTVNRKRVRNNNENIINDLSSASTTFTAAANNISESICGVGKIKEDGYVLTILERLSFVQQKHMTRCLIEIFKVFSEYEEMN